MIRSLEAELQFGQQRRTIAMRYLTGAMFLGGAGFIIGDYGFGLLWPAISLAAVFINYAFLGPEGFRKRPNGQMSLPIVILLAPYLLGAWINSRVWTWEDPAPVCILPGIMLGRIPSRAEAPKYRTIIDLCAELPATSRKVDWQSFPMLDLITPDASRLRAAAAAIEASKVKGPMLVCCALGYSRSVCALAVWLVSSGRAANASEAIEQIRRVRPKIVIDHEDRASIDNSVMVPANELFGRAG
jgi:hypothetical protein